MKPRAINARHEIFRLREEHKALILLQNQDWSTAFRSTVVLVISVFTKWACATYDAAPKSTYCKASSTSFFKNTFMVRAVENNCKELLDFYCFL